MRKTILLIVYLLLPATIFSQEFGELKGTITEEDGKTPIPFANIIIEQNGILVTGQMSDIDGNFWIKNILPGTYNVKVTCVGLQPYMIDLVIADLQITYLNPTLESRVVLKEYVIVNDHYRVNACYSASYTTISRNNIASNKRSKTKKVKIFAKGIKNKKIKKTKDPNTEVYKGIVENRFEDVQKDPLSTFSVDVDRASYANIRRMINDGYLPNKDVIRLEEMINYFSYDYPQPSDEHPFSINMETSTCPWNKDHHLIMIGLQGKNYEPEVLPPSNLVFLIDVSGSMGVWNKLPLVKSSLTALVNQMRVEDKISIVVYAGAAGLVLPTTSGRDKGTILAALDNLEAGGSTAGGAGINLAYDIAEKNYDKNANNRIILCTDGDFNVGVSSETELEDLIVSKRDKGIYITVLGYGIGNYKDNYMEILADKGNGNYAYIDSQTEANKVLVKEIGGTLFTIAKDVKVQIEFNPANIKSYRLLGYENRLLEDWEFKDDKRDAGEIGAGHSVTAIYEVELNNTDPSSSNNVYKYQTMVTNTGFEDELVTLKFRYKPKDSNKSRLVERTIHKDAIKLFDQASENLRFASSVIAFGMVLRNSEYKGLADIDLILDIAKNAQIFDEDGYRAEFINLVETSRSLKPRIN